MLRAVVIIPVLLCYSLMAFSQLKSISAIKVAEAPIIDGWLDEAVWEQAPAARGFITHTPSFGLPAGDSTVVRVLYDNNAIYIGAYLFGDPTQIRKQFSPRDQERQADADHFAVFIDSYHDRQNAFQFLVTSRNVQSDARVSSNIPPQDGVYGDLNWDAVWESKTSMQIDGWSVEIRIPLFSLRFSNKNQQWGIQFLRYSRRLNESSFWNPQDPNISGFANQFGDLTGLEHLVAPLRLSFSPYVSGGLRRNPSVANGRSSEWLKSGGMDVKYGISESFTLDATLIPDFGQVISDNVVNNISPFEIQFRENRQFFTEGTELFNKADIFYSRRVGRQPEGYQSVLDNIHSGNLANYEILKNPESTRLLNAIKLSGRTARNLGIGFFNAIAQPEVALLRNRITGRDSAITTEGLANYNVFVLDQALKNRSYLTFTNTNVLRNSSARDANVSAFDLALYNKNNTFGLLLKPRYSKIFNSGGGYDGFKNYLELGKVSGKLQYSFSNEIRSVKYDPNDLGYLSAPNQVDNTAKLSYNIYQPKGKLLNQQYSLTLQQSYLYKPFEYEKTEVVAYSSLMFRNFWTTDIELGARPFWFNDFFELQTPADIFRTPRQKLKRAPYYYLFANVATDTRKRLYTMLGLGASEGPLPDDPFFKVEMEVRYRFSDRFSLTANYLRQHDNGQFGYSFMRDPTTEGPILARRKYTDVTSIVSGIYNINRRMNITFRARHFWNRILNTNLYDMKNDGYWTEKSALTMTDYNMNYNAFNLDVFYTWDFRPGSRLIFAWKNSLGMDYENYINGNIYRSYVDNAARLFRTPHGNELTLRFIYFLNYQQLRKR